MLHSKYSYMASGIFSLMKIATSGEMLVCFNLGIFVCVRLDL